MIYRIVPAYIGLRKMLHFSDESGNQQFELCKLMIVEQINNGCIVKMVWMPLRFEHQYKVIDVCKGGKDGMYHLSLSVSHEYQGYDVVTRVVKYGAV